MITRYTRPQMAAHWSDGNRYATWLKVELAALESQAEMGLVPAKEAAEIASKARFDVAPHRGHRGDGQARRHRLHDLGGRVHRRPQPLLPLRPDVLRRGGHLPRAHDAGRPGPHPAGRGRASSPSSRSRPSPTRTRSASAGPTASTASPPPSGSSSRSGTRRWGATARACSPPARASPWASSAAPWGPSPTCPPSWRSASAPKLGLKPDPVSTQVIQRDRHAEVLCAMAITGATLEKIATEIRHLQKTEVREAEEPFSKGQKGSSAMPHKRNPVSCENMTGLARLLRGYARPGPRGRGALARAGHLALLRGARHPPRRHHAPGLHAQPARRASSTASSSTPRPWPRT